MNEISRLKIGKEESTYRLLYSDLLKKHKGILNRTSASDDLDHAAENELLGNIFSTERNALLLGVAAGLAMFGTLRFGPKFYAQHIGGTKMVDTMKAAEAEAKKRRTEDTQRAIGTNF